MSNNKGNGFLGLISGLGLGALIGVLYAPKSGKSLRKDIKNYATEVSEEARTKLEKKKKQLQLELLDIEEKLEKNSKEVEKDLNKKKNKAK